MIIYKLLFSLIVMLFLLTQNNLVFGDELDETSSMSTKTYEESIIKNKIKNRLLKVGKVDSEYIRNVLSNNYLKEAVLETDFGYLIITGKAGTAKGSIQKGQYTISVKPIPNFDIQIPNRIDIFSDGIIQLSVKKGSGKIEQTGSLTLEQRRSPTNNMTDSEENFPEITVAIISSDDQQVLPLAKFEVKLTRIHQEKTINLLQGWNLITLTALPDKTITAALLISEITTQGGYAVTVSTLENGVWKSYVQRGENNYSVEDFPLIPGKAYFVKSLKPSTLTFRGQNLVNPVSLELNKGWNAVGFPNLQESLKASRVIDQLNSSGGVDADAIASFESGLWETLVKKDKEDFGENFPIYNNRGYILRVDKAGEVVLK